MVVPEPESGMIIFYFYDGHDKQLIWMRLSESRMWRIGIFLKKNYYWIMNFATPQID